MPAATIERTAAGTARCTSCRQEWIAADLDDHEHPQCLMWVLRCDDLPPPPVR
jgi:hypothetical protein